MEVESLEKALRGERGGRRMSKWLCNRELAWHAMGLWFNPQHPSTQTGYVIVHTPPGTKVSVCSQSFMKRHTTVSF